MIKTIPKQYMELVLNHISLELLPQKAAFCSEHGSLFVADAHFGKTTTFRRAGIPVPEGTLDHDLSRLDMLISTKNVHHLFFLGDLFHSYHNQEWEVFTSWRGNHSSLNITLVEGNHDVLSSNDYKRADLAVVPEPFLWNGIELRHHPSSDSENMVRPVLCGHVHPGVRVTSSGKFNETLPCFFLRGMQLTLPSFGSFTGLGHINPEKGDRFFVSGSEEVMEIPVT
jgi:DNA ligase-associated metallophosphoesterase